MPLPPTGRPPIVDLDGPERDAAIDALRESFTGVYRWHAKRTLREVPVVRAIRRDGRVAAAALLDRLDPDVGYVYYLFVARAFRRQGFGASLLDDALRRFRAEGIRAVFAACEDENVASIGLFRSRGFRPVRPDEPRVREGGLGAYGYRRRMWVVPGETLLGLRLDAPEGGTVAGALP